MDARDSASRLRPTSLASRRRFGQWLNALTMFGGVVSIAGFGASEAKKKHKKHKKKKKCPKPAPPPFCTGKNSCAGGGAIGCSDGDVLCVCLVAETGAPVCAVLSSGVSVFDCNECDEGRTCVYYAPGCSAIEPLACVLPCPNPL